MKKLFVLALLFALPVFAEDAAVIDVDAGYSDRGPSASVNAAFYADKGLGTNVTVTDKYGHDNLGIEFFGHTKHRLHLLLHGAESDPNPRVVKAYVGTLVKDPPAPRTAHLEMREYTVQVPTVTMTTETREISTTVRDIPPPQTSHVETRSVSVCVPVTKMETRTVQNCVPVTTMETRSVQTCVPVIRMETRSIPTATCDVCGNRAITTREVQVPVTVRELQTREISVPVVRREMQTREISVPVVTKEMQTREYSVTVKDPLPPITSHVETRQITVQVPVKSFRTETRTASVCVRDEPAQPTYHTEYKAMVIPAAPVCQRPKSSPCP